MQFPALKSLARAKLALLAAVATGAVLANQLSANVGLQVRVVSSSGACEAVSTAPAVQVSCHAPVAPTPAAPVATEPSVEPVEQVGPGGPLLPEPGAVPFQRAGTIRAAGIGAATETVPVFSDGTKITSWRVVQLDNARYLELTIAW